MSKDIKKGLYAGSFDPLTNGHLNLIERASKVFNEVVVLIAINTTKKSLFSPEERVSLVTDAVAHIPNVRVDILHDGLVATYFREHDMTAMVRGIRNTTDYELEYNIYSVNKKQFDDLETVILYAADEYRYLSSTIIKEIAYFDGDISDMVPPNVAKAMKEKYQTDNE